MHLEALVRSNFRVNDRRDMFIHRKRGRDSEPVNSFTFECRLPIIRCSSCHVIVMTAIGLDINVLFFFCKEKQWMSLSLCLGNQNGLFLNASLPFALPNEGLLITILRPFVDIFLYCQELCFSAFSSEVGIREVVNYLEYMGELTPLEALVKMLQHT